MAEISRKKIRKATAIYWLMLIYIIAALIWWFISLQNQTNRIAAFRLQQLQSVTDSISSPMHFNQVLHEIQEEKRRDYVKHVSEGLFFLALIIIAAVFVFRSVRRQFRQQLQQQHFMMAVTHELKTPISVAMLNLETIQKHQLDPERQQKLIRMSLEEIGRLNFLTSNILISSQLEGGGYAFSKEELDLSDLLKDCIQDFRNRFPDRVIRDQIEEDAEVKGDPLLLQILINNLLENAMKYAPKEKAVTASLKKGDATIDLIISDEGPGIPGEEKKKIFLKFYRIGSEATRKNKGTGLGLYLCRKISEDHQANLTVTDNEQGGSDFVVRFFT